MLQFDWQISLGKGATWGYSWSRPMTGLQSRSRLASPLNHQRTCVRTPGCQCWVWTCGRTASGHRQGSEHHSASDCWTAIWFQSEDCMAWKRSLHPFCWDPMELLELQVNSRSFQVANRSIHSKCELQQFWESKTPKVNKAIERSKEVWKLSASKKLFPQSYQC